LKSDLTDFQYNFVKVECTSTYPRLIFILKFLPILAGVGLIQIFSQNNLSRNTENDKSYKEFQISYGSDIKLNTNIDFIYHEPKKLKEIEKFFLEFFIITKQNEEFFYDTNHDLKYLDYSLLAIINEVMNSEKITLNSEHDNNSVNNNKNQNSLNNSFFLMENILFKINNLYYEFYVNGTEYEKMRIQDDNNSNDVYSNNKNTNYNNLNDTSQNNNNNINRQILNTGNANNVIINNNSDSATMQTYNPNFLQISKDLFLKEILNITNNFIYLNVNNLQNINNFNNNNNNVNNFYYNGNKYDNTLILSKNEIYNANLTPNNFDQSLDLTNKFSDLSALDEEKYNAFYNNTHSNLGLNNYNNRQNNLLNNISASFDVILSSLYPRNINTDVGYESQMVTTNMIMANINTININNSIGEGVQGQNAPNNFSMAANLPLTNGNNLNTTLSINENNNNINNLYTNNNMNNINTLNFNTMGNIPLSLNGHLNTNSNNYNNINMNNVNNSNNNYLPNKNTAPTGRINTLGSFGKSIHSNNNINIDKPQISIQNFASPLRNKLVGNLGNKLNGGIPIPHLGSVNSNININKNLIQKNTRGSQGANDMGKILKLNLLLNQQNDINCNFLIFICGIIILYI